MMQPKHVDERLINQEISLRITSMIRSRRTTQMALARAIGVSTGGVSHRLNGGIRWTIPDVYRAAEFFDCRLSELFPARDSVHGGS